MIGRVPPLSDLSAWRELAAESRRSQGVATSLPADVADIVANIVYQPKEHAVTNGSATSSRPHAPAPFSDVAS